MQFEAGHIYHIFNQGNNRQKIFFEDKNYRFFLQKVGRYILPYADILAYCLMPNHFHLMVKVKVNSSDDVSSSNSSDDSKSSDEYPLDSKSSDESAARAKRTLNNSIAIMLRSYTRVINKQESISGSLFRQKTKAQCLTEPAGLSPAWFQTSFGTQLNTDFQEDSYLQVCFNYIHQNPVNAGLVKSAEDWEFSSYRAYLQPSSNIMVNRAAAKEEFLLFTR